MDGLDDMNEYDSDNMDIMSIRAKYNNISGFDIMVESDSDEFEDLHTVSANSLKASIETDFLVTY